MKRLSRATLGPAKTETVVRPDGSYILTGGLRGLGLAMARWLVDSGAGRVVLNGRSEPSEEAQALIAELEQRAQIAVVLGDIAAPGVAEKLVSAAEETGLTLRGLMHSAVVLDDQIVAGLSQDSLERVWAPKAIGALRLHVATADKELDWWVGFSSTSSLLGAPGQGAYAAASAWLDGLVEWRRASGLPATTINWGQWSDIGVARSLTFSALDPISPAEGIEALEAILASQPTNIGVARLRLDRAAAAFPEIQQLGFFAKLAEELDLDDEDDDWAGPDALRELDARRGEPPGHRATERTHPGHHGLPEGQHPRRRSAADRTGHGFAYGGANPQHCSWRLRSGTAGGPAAAGRLVDRIDHRLDPPAGPGDRRQGRQRWRGS